MAKKHQRNLQQLLKKRQQFQNLNRLPTQPTPTALPGQPSTVIVPEQPKVAALEAPRSAFAGREVSKTLLSFVVILALLIVVVVIDRKAPFLNQWGEYLYQALRLNS